MDTLVQHSDGLVWTCECGESLRFSEAAAVKEVDNAIWTHRAAHSITRTDAARIASRVVQTVNERGL